ncbi:unnamed protein product [Gadus morhua 'NCC']
MGQQGRHYTRSVTGFGTVEEGADRILQCPGSLGGLLPPAAGQRRATSVICCQHRPLVRRCHHRRTWH